MWNKLRELYPICDSILDGDSLYNRVEVDKLILKCKDKTRPEVTEIFIRFRSKGDKLLQDLGIDKYEFRDTLIEISDELRKVVDEGDKKVESELRKTYTPKDFKNFRLLLSALQKEEVYTNKKWNVKIKQIVKNKSHSHHH